MKTSAFPQTRIFGVFPDYEQASAKVDELLRNDMAANMTRMGSCWLVNTVRI